MQYVITFAEGMLTFISPCLLPMIPIYVSYFAGGGERKPAAALKCAAGFVLGFTVVFVLLGALAGTVGSFVAEHGRAVDIVTGLIVVFFGLIYLEVINLNPFRGIKHSVDTNSLGFISAMIFGAVFSVGWTPCTGAFLGSALMLASQQGHVASGILMLLAYSAGLGLPFILSAVLIERMKSAFELIRRNYRLINRVCGAFLIVMGVLMITGYMGRMISLLG
ncbi:MAG: cytochrome c biogenesis CcdA family protein [Bacillota bacterium]|nr:cytochrome c biogenesis CcdA family protein [Bacillota bacterium]